MTSQKKSYLQAAHAKTTRQQQGAVSIMQVRVEDTYVDKYTRPDK